MMIKAKGPVWHKKDKEKGVIPDGLRGLDQRATWCKSGTGKWVYGHGTFSLTSNENPVPGCFMHMRNSADEAKRLWLKTYYIKDQIDYLVMDSKADDYDLFREFKRQRKVDLLTCGRKNMDKSPNRKKMFDFMQILEHKKIYRERSYKVEPMQDLVKDIFGLDYCWMRGDINNRWIFAVWD
jgi:hypothetical protein